MRHRLFPAILAAALSVPALPAAESIPDRPAERVERPSRLLTVGRAYTVEAKGCESRVAHYRVTAIQPIDRTKIDKQQILSGVFFRSRESSGHSGWRNVGYSADGRSIEFDLFAEGAGSMERREPGRRAVSLPPSPARSSMSRRGFSTSGCPKKV